DDIAEIIAQVLKDSGIEVLLKSQCISATEDDGEIKVSYHCEEGKKSISSPHVLVAAGRIPNTDDLGLENTDVVLDDHGFIKVNDELQTSAPNIWAL
ncbi:FAD-dependent oxidoreductase, partial [Tamlana crocina]|uniref:FAD-dependent oxidoreductase n=1 Tax=Tamlana crocina TaxID=393006 RepID=UPI001FD736E7